MFQEIKKDGVISNVDIICNLVFVDMFIDIVNVVKMSFEEQNYEFGEVMEGEIIEYIFKFRNMGKVLFVIQGVCLMCGCIVLEWLKDLILVGEEGEIFVCFDIKNKWVWQVKFVIIMVNFYLVMIKVYLCGFVQEEGVE